MDSKKALLLRLLVILFALIALADIKKSSAQNTWVEMKSEQAETLGATALAATDERSGNSCVVIHLPKDEIQGERLAIHAFVAERGENFHFAGTLMMSPHSRQVAMLIQRPVDKQVGDTWQRTKDNTPRIFAEYCSEPIKSLPREIKKLFYGLFGIDELGEIKEKPKPIPSSPKPESPVCYQPCYTQFTDKEAS